MQKDALKAITKIPSQGKQLRRTKWGWFWLLSSSLRKLGVVTTTGFCLFPKLPTPCTSCLPRYLSGFENVNSTVQFNVGLFHGQGNESDSICVVMCLLVCFVLVNLIQDTIIWEPGNSVEKMPLLVWPIGSLWGIFVNNDWCRRAQVTLASASPEQVFLGHLKKSKLSKEREWNNWEAFLHGFTSITALW